MRDCTNITISKYLVGSPIPNDNIMKSMGQGGGGGHCQDELRRSILSQGGGSQKNISQACQRG